MHTPDMVKQEGDDQNGYSYSLNPQLINYSAPADSKLGKKIAQSQFGIVVHTGYPNATWKPNAKTGEMMLSFPKRHFNVPLRSFGSHPDVNIIDPRAQKPNPENHTTDAQSAYDRAIKTIKILSEKHDFDHAAPYADHFSTYINQTVKTGEPLTFEGLKDHISQKFEKQIQNPKNAKKALALSQKRDEMLNELDQSSIKWRQTMRIHDSLTEAKHALLQGLDANAQGNPNLMQGSISDPDTGELVNSQEGHVVVMRNPDTGNDVPTKFIDRPNFSRLNFNRARFAKNAAAAPEQETEQ